jgi:nitroreductase
MVAELLEPENAAIVADAYVNYVVFLDLERSKDRVNDLLSIGAFIENMLLCAEAVEGLGAVWIGKIPEQKQKLSELFKINPEKFEPISIISMGAKDTDKPSQSKEERIRRPITDFIDYF